jgi:hypothetical protein
VICGVTIGEHAFIGAGTVVTSDVPAHGFVVGNPRSADRVGMHMRRAAAGRSPLRLSPSLRAAGRLAGPPSRLRPSMYVTLRSLPNTSDVDVGATTFNHGTGAQSQLAVLAFGAVSLLADVSSESVAAVLPLYITAVPGMGPLAYGFIDGIYQGVSAAVRILGGWWSASTNSPDVWLRLATSPGNVPNRPALGDRLRHIAAVIAVDRLRQGPTHRGPSDALIATASDPADLGRNFGVHRAMDTAGALAGPLLAFAI